MYIRAILITSNVSNLWFYWFSWKTTYFRSKIGVEHISSNIGNILHTCSKERLKLLKITILFINWSEIALEQSQVNMLCTIRLFFNVKPYFAKKYVYGNFRVKNMNFPLQKSLKHHKSVFLPKYGFTVINKHILHNIFTLGCSKVISVQFMNNMVIFMFPSLTLEEVCKIVPIMLEIRSMPFFDQKHVVFQ